MHSFLTKMTVATMTMLLPEPSALKNLTLKPLHNSPRIVRATKEYAIEEGASFIRNAGITESESNVTIHLSRII